MSDTFTVAVDLPKGMLEQMKARAKRLQFHDVQFYVRWLVAKDVAPESADANLGMALIHEGDRSGPGEVVDEAFIQRLIAETDSIIEENAAKAKRAAG